MNRRNFLRTSAGASLALGLSTRLSAKLAESPYMGEIGVQLYTLRNEIGKDPAGTMKAVAEAGYKQVELYAMPQADAVIKAAKENNLALNSSHIAWDYITQAKDEKLPDFRKIVETLKANGFSHAVIPFLHNHERKNLDDYKKLAGRFNSAALIAKEAGLTLSYHNHAFEFEPLADGKSGFDVFIDEFGPDMMFELDVFWVKVGGKDPVAMIEKLKGRVTQLHLKDLDKAVAIPNFGSIPNEAFQEIGDGIIDMAPVVKAASANGVKHCHVEQDQSPDALASIRQSIAYLKAN